MENFPWISFAVFALVGSITPGPNVIMLASSGSAFGFRRTLPHVLGITFGFPLMLLLVQFGADAVFKIVPWLFSVLIILSLIYVIWLSIKIFKLAFAEDLALDPSAKPFSFLQAAGFQWINGKAWQIAIMVATLYPSQQPQTKILGSFLFAVITFLSCALWVEIGKRIAVLLSTTWIKRTYYSALAVSLLLATVPGGIKQFLSWAWARAP